MIGQIIQDYEILEQVGEGAMAIVYRGRHVRRRDEVAIKVLHEHLTTNERTRTRFEREARAVASLDCPNIPKIFGFLGGEDQRWTLITEFVRGPTLRELLQDVGAIPSEPAVLILDQVCEALDMAHQQGIIHRDIKPANIMIDTGGVVKLMDFGVARIADEVTITLTGTLVGSPAFMSPEQARNAKLDHRSDLFSVGTLLFLMVTGELPFAGTTPAVLLGALIDGEHRDPLSVQPTMHPLVARIIERCLHRDREDRYPDVDALRADLRAALDASEIAGTGDCSVDAFVRDPEGYRERLHAHLIGALPRLGEALLDEGQPALGMALLNRVLTLDEGNDAVLSLIASRSV